MDLEKIPVMTEIFPVIVNHLVGLVVKASASRAEDPGFESRWRRDFAESSHTSELYIGTPVATLPGAWLYRFNGAANKIKLKCDLNFVKLNSLAVPSYQVARNTTCCT